MEGPRVVPLFPLSTVLFPGMVLPLRIFEPRYRLMVRRLLEGDPLAPRQFGIALIQEGHEVGTPATSYEVGTLAEINAHEVMPDGQIMLVCVGMRRFRILRHVEGEPYQQAEIVLIDEGDAAAPIAPGLAEEAETTLAAYLKALGSVTNLNVVLPEDPLSPTDLSYLMAATVQVDNERKQDLLETVPVEERLRKVLKLIDRENERIAAFLAKGRTRGDFFYRGNRMSMN